ncbi:MAG: GumC family protein [Candidatus Korobacteraceae bacterium]
MILGRNLGPEDYLAILRRRFWWILVPTLIGPVLAYAYSMTLPNVYTSKAVVLAERQRIPGEFVRPVITQGLGERLATMQEQILSRTRLQPVIEKFGLFKDVAPGANTEQLMDRMRSAIAVRPVASGEREEISGFSISFSYSNPRTAQEVCAQITSMFMEENLRSRERSAEGTTKFLNTEMEDAKRKLDDQDSKLAEFEGRFIGQLPGQEQANFSMLQSLNGQMDALNQAVYRMEQDKAYTEGLLAQQINAWKQTQTANNPVTLEQQLANERAGLVNLMSRYTETHPDVQRAKRDIAALERRVETARMNGGETTTRPQAVSEQEPSGVQQLRHQLHNLELTLAERRQQQERLQRQIATYQSRVQLSPAVHQEWKQLTRDYQTALEFYNDLLKKSQLSEIATNLERQQQGEQLGLMDPPNLPSSPSSPDRQKIATGGLGGGLLIGLGIALLFELKDKALRTEADVQDLLQLRTLAMVPDLEHNQGNKRRRSLRDKLRRRPRNSEQDFVPNRIGV